MSTTKLATRIIGVALAGSLALLGAALAQQKPSSTQMIDALKPQITRTLNTAKAAEERKVVDQLRSLSRKIVMEERKQLEEIAKDKPQISLEVTFNVDSAVINAKALPLLQDLGKALSSPELKGSVFMLAGHTDASGSDEHNQG